MGREIGGRFQREGTWVYLWLILVDVWQKTTKFCKATIFQLKNKLKRKLKEIEAEFYQICVLHLLKISQNIFPQKLSCCIVLTDMWMWKQPFILQESYLLFRPPIPLFLQQGPLPLQIQSKMRKKVRLEETWLTSQQQKRGRKIESQW